MTEPERPNPDALLAAIQKDDAARRRGKLKVFLGMAAGVGKTYAMLEAARKEQRAGRDVVIGYVETHGRKETDALAQGLPLIPRRGTEYRGVKLTEMDLDEVLARRPQLALVDEFAHTNAPDSRHPKRWQDVLELLDAGIDVFTTLNIQHVESRTDAVRQITLATVHETVPDSALKGAEIEVIDLPPEELLERLQEGKVYSEERAEAALFNFFREGNLNALREMALRFAAERVSEDVRDYMRAMQIEGPWKSGERLLVAVSASPYSAQMVRWTRRLADTLHCPWIAVHVEAAQPADEAAQAQLNKNLSLAKELGAEVITTAGEDMVSALLRVARSHNATQIIVGKPGDSWLARWRGGRFLQRLLGESGGIDIHIVRADKVEGGDRPFTLRLPEQAERRQYWFATGIVLAVTGVNALLDYWVGYRTVALTYLLSVVGLALFLGRGPLLLAAFLSAMLWNFFFLPPRFTFYISGVEDALMFGMYFIVALVLGQLITRIRAQERAERRREERATALYLLSRELAEAVSADEIVRKVIAQVEQAFPVEAALLLTETNGQLARQPHSASRFDVSEKEHSVAAWAFKNSQATGRFTDNLPLADALHLPLRTASVGVGVLALRWRGTGAPTLDQRNLLDAFSRQTALVLDRQRLRETAENNRLLGESERLGKTLLNSISHELRTPLAAITSAASGLGELGDSDKPALRHALTNEIREASKRLNRLVGNLLDMTRLESGHVKPRLDWCDVADLVGVALRQTERELAQHHVTTTLTPHLPLVRMDFVLMEQALTNLLLNAALHTPAGTKVCVSAAVGEKEVLLSVADSGPGVPADALSHIFDKFYRGPNAAAGGSGLGLSIVKGFVEAQGGHVSARNRLNGGAEFTLALPLGDVPATPDETTA